MKASEIEREIVSYAVSLNIMTIKLPHMPHRFGHTWMFISPNGATAFLLFAKEDDVLKSTQTDFLHDLENNGQVVHVIRSTYVGIRVVRELL